MLIFCFFFVFLYKIDNARTLSVYKKNIGDCTYLCLHEASIDALKEMTITPNIDEHEPRTDFLKNFDVPGFIKSVPPASGANSEMHPYLPVQPFRKEILSKISQNQVVLISGETGNE